MSYFALHGESKRTGRATGLDGTQLHWEIYGSPSPSGRPAVVCCNGIGCSTFFWHYISRYFAADQEVLLWDYRSHGDSGRAMDRSRVSMRDNADDLEAVLADAGLESVITVGHSMGCQVILEHYRHYPERIQAMVPMLGTYGKAVDTFFDSDFVARHFETLHKLSHKLAEPLQAILRFVSKNPLTYPVANKIGLVSGGMIKKADLLPYLEHMADLDVRFFMDMARELGNHSAEDILENIQVPVLIIGGEKDIFTPVWLSEKMHRMIPGSEMTILPGGSHAALVEQPEFINLRIEKFLNERVWEGAGKTESKTAKILEDTSDTRAHMS